MFSWDVWVVEVVGDQLWLAPIVESTSHLVLLHSFIRNHYGWLANETWRPHASRRTWWAAHWVHLFHWIFQVWIRAHPSVAQADNALLQDIVVLHGTTFATLVQVRLHINSLVYALSSAWVFCDKSSASWIAISRAMLETWRLYGAIKLSSSQISALLLFPAGVSSVRESGANYVAQVEGLQMNRYLARLPRLNNV